MQFRAFQAIAVVGHTCIRKRALYAHEKETDVHTYTTHAQFSQGGAHHMYIYRYHIMYICVNVHLIVCMSGVYHTCTLYI